MTSTVRYIGFVLFAVGAAIFSTPALAQSAAPSAADQTELQAIAETDLAPLKEKAQAAIDLATSDPDQACELAKASANLATDAQQRFATVYTRMTGEGVNVASLSGMKANLDAAPARMTQFASAVCNGQIAAMQNNAASKDMTQINVYVKSYTDDIVAADAAADRGDGATACHLAGDASQQLDDLTRAVANMRKTPSLPANDRKALNELDPQIAEFKTVNDNRLKACAAAR